jgi:DNA-binding HxlR family transcriptional regulator
MRPYAQYCPISKAAEVLGDRWSLLILRDLLVGVRRFNDLARGLPGLSRPLLSKRLRQLSDAGLVRRSEDGYELTDAGEDLRGIVMNLAEWGARWAFGEPDQEDLDPDLLVWWMHRRIDRSRLPNEVVVVQLQLSNPHSWYWLVLEPGDVSVCLTDPGFDVSVVLRSEVATLYDVWLGRLDYDAAVRDELVTLTGQPALVGTARSWLRLSPVADIVSAVERS